ncbi:IS30 family transposase [Streptomyces goshikiensis]|uniref:IS30 family transposase n=1 Tax=Streptomyces goshikiensis TaxID=1942 RepID=UPI0036AD15BF
MPPRLRRTLTWDPGREMAEHRAITTATDVPIHFCKPRSTWQRGTNENTNRLLRQYLPEGVDLRAFSQEYLDAVAAELNNRPRKIHGYRTPAEICAEHLNGGDALTA